MASNPAKFGYDSVLFEVGLQIVSCDSVYEQVQLIISCHIDLRAFSFFRNYIIDGRVAPVRSEIILIKDPTGKHNIT